MRLDQAIFVGVAKASAEAAISPDRHGILQAGIVKHRKAHVVLWLSHISVSFDDSNAYDSSEKVIHELH